MGRQRSGWTRILMGLVGKGVNEGDIGRKGVETLDRVEKG